MSRGVVATILRVVSRLRWRMNRFRAMEVSEVVWRAGRSAQTRWEQLRAQIRLEPSVPAPSGRCGGRWVALLPKGIAPACYVTAGERILSGNFEIFSLRPARLGFPPDWNNDPKTGTEAPMSFGKTLNYRIESIVGDIKYLWEPNRHLEVVTLSQGFYLTGDARFAAGARTLLESWFEQCPYPWGPNWTSSLEHAVRLANWSYAWHLLGGEDSPLFEDKAGERFKQTWLNSVYRHLRFINGYFSHYSSANNHLLGEYMGLFIGTTTWPLWRECREWSALAKNGLEHEVLRQIEPDGVLREQAIWYEHEVADMLLHCGLIGRANGVEFSEAYWGRLVAILEHLASVMDVAGHLPMFGDSDNAVIVRLSQEPNFHPYRSLLSTGAVLFNRSDFRLKAEHFDDKSRWWLGDDAAAAFEALPVDTAKLPIRRAFTTGGYWILGDRFESSEEVRLVVDAGTLGYPSIAAHGHADALSFTLSVKGKEILVDPGTYAYHTERKWRDYFRGTSAHNTMRVAGQNQSLIGGSFLWLRHACAECHHFDSSTERDEWEASHDGYLCLPEPVRHRRRIILDKRAQKIEVTDRLEGVGHHLVELFWHFAEDCSVNQVGEYFKVYIDSLTVWLLPPAGLKTRLVSAAEAPPLGWVSRCFDEKTPSMTLVCDGTTEAGVTFRTVFGYGTSPPELRGTSTRDVASNIGRYEAAVMKSG